MGKGFGGGSSVNAMIGREATKHSAPPRRGSGGLVYVQPLEDRHAMEKAMLASASALGIPSYSDSNGRMMEVEGGASQVNVRIRDGKRLSIAGPTSTGLLALQVYASHTK
jgi:hypothetical protein